MPKRSYPFAESFSSQYKIHIGQKELNHGVFGNQYKQEIYEKTKNLLLNGTKAVMGKIWKVDGGNATDPQPATVTPAANQTLLRGQTLIGFDGRLKRVTPVQGAVMSAAGCRVCLKTQGTMRPCSQCERPICPSCTRQCSSCCLPCCPVCTVVDYSGQYDQELCCGCSS